MKWQYTFATDGLIAIGDTVLFRGAERTGHFRTFTTSVHAILGHVFNSVHSHFGTCPIRNIVTLGHVISGQARFRTAQLHYFKLL